VYLLLRDALFFFSLPKPYPSHYQSIKYKPTSSFLSKSKH
jgi:hypothetical protein